MRKVLLIFIAVILTANISCTKQEVAEQQQEKQEFMKVIRKVVNEFEGEDTTNTIIECSYENEDDIFWTKQVHKDGDGNELKTIERELDSAGYPVKEFTKEMGEITESAETKYCHDCKHLVEKTVYLGEIKASNKSKYIKYEYDEGRLIGKHYEKFNRGEKFKNVDGNKVEMSYTVRYMPGKECRPAGKFGPGSFFENLTRYCTGHESSGNKMAHGEGHKGGKHGHKKEKKKCSPGQIEMALAVDFNDQGMPVMMKSKEPECGDSAEKEWYKVEKDGIGNIKSITSYANEALDSSSAENMKTIFSYNSKGYVAKVEELKYNEETGKYDRYHDLKKINWVKTGLNNKYAEYCPEVYREHYCYHRGMYSVTKEKITFKDGKKVVEEYNFSLSSEDGPKPDSVDLELSKRKSIEYTTKKI